MAEKIAIDPRAEWAFVGSCLSGQAFTIGGINVWDFDWSDGGEAISLRVPHPPTGSPVWVTIYCIELLKRSVQFAAGRLPGDKLWVFYIPVRHRMMKEIISGEFAAKRPHGWKRKGDAPVLQAQ